MSRGAWFLAVIVAALLVVHPGEVVAQEEPACMLCVEQFFGGQIYHSFVSGSEQVCDDPEENNEDCAACGWESECHTSEEPGGWEEGGCHEDCFETLARAADMVERWVHSNDGSLPQAPLVLAMNGRLQYDPTDGVLRLRDCTSTSIVASWVVPPQKRRLVRVAAAT